MSDLTNVQPRQGQAVQISPHVWAIPLTFYLTGPNGAAIPRLVHAYIISGERERVLVDCGPAGCLPDVMAGIAAAGLGPEHIHRLLATHEHADHMGSALRLTQQYNWPIAAHTAARRWLEDAPLQYRERPLPNFETLMAGSVTVAQPLNEGDVIDLGGCAARVLHTPGHSVGSLSLVIQPDGVIITADALISAVGAPFYDDPAAVRASVEKLRRELAGGSQMVSSHAATPSWVTAQALDDTLALVGRMETAARQAQAEVGAGDENALTRRALDLAGWTHQAVMPITRITVRAHLAQL